MRSIARLIGAALVVAVLLLSAYGAVRAVDRLWGGDGLALLREPVEPVRVETLDPYTERVAGKRWFTEYFTTIVFSRTSAPGSPRIVAKWERPTVRVELLNDGEGEAGRYLAMLLRRLDRLQDQVDFELGGPRPLITVELLGHAAYVSRNGDGSVGTTRTRYVRGSPGLVRSRIMVDAGTQDTPGELRSTLIHELSHAIGLNGHFTSPSDRRRSVMYAANTLTKWSQADAAAIRILYSPFVRSGMSPAEAEAGVRRYARAARAAE